MNTGKGNRLKKRHANAFIVFTRIAIGEYKRRYPEDKIIVTDFTKKCAEHWKTMGREDRKKFKALADMDKARCDHQHGHRKEEEEGRIVERRCPFYFFSNDFRSVLKEANPMWSSAEVISALRKNWKVYVDKEKYKVLAQKDRERYKEEMKAYLEGRRDVPTSEAVSKPGSNCTCGDACKTQIPCCSTTTTSTAVVGGNGPISNDEKKCRIGTELGRKPLEECEKCNEVVTTTSITTKQKLPFLVEFLI
ncbi:unnamed protein product [Trichobilharzia szidati]|nr:unnamed protein product [Trichobilharzia szidati]